MASADAGAAMSAYTDIIASKRVAFEPAGLSRIPELNPGLFHYQRDVTEFLLRCGRGAAFLDTGLGKSFVALEWGRVLVEFTNCPVLMLAPLAVSQQHQREAEKFGIDAKAIRDGSEIKGPRIYITNYERLERFDPELFSAVILDESSILKGFAGATTRTLIASFSKTPYRLACTATPAPNDHMELGQHSEFLGAMRGPEMLMRWFINDTAEASQKWRLKGHAASSFWDWVASWARCIAKPSDLGFSDDGFALPALDEIRHLIGVDRSVDSGSEKDGQARLFRMPESSATSVHREKKITVDARADAIAALVSADQSEPWIVWCDTNAEADALKDRMPFACEVRGDMRPDDKEDRLVSFSLGKERVLISKPSICGFGLNWQHCARMAFVGLSFSYESYYQAIRRCWRFGQKRPVEVHIALAETEAPIWAAICRKAKDHEAMKAEMCAAMARAQTGNRFIQSYQPVRNVTLPAWLSSARAA
jgi:hypothetical protein